MKKIFIILLISNNLLAQDVLTESFGSENLETLNYSFSKKDLTKIEDNQAQITLDNPRLDNRFGVNINIGSPTIGLSVSFDCFITSSVNIEAGGGLFGLFGGIKYHFFGSKNTANWTPYLGLFYAYNLSIFNNENTNLYVPLGLQYTSNEGFTFGVELAGRFLITSANNSSSLFDNSSDYIVPLWGAIKFGYHFKTY
jgi:hypothetical protein